MAQALADKNPVKAQQYARKVIEMAPDSPRAARRGTTGSVQVVRFGFCRFCRLSLMLALGNLRRAATHMARCIVAHADPKTWEIMPCFRR